MSVGIVELRCLGSVWIVVRVLLLWLWGRDLLDLWLRYRLLLWVVLCGWRWWLLGLGLRWDDIGIVVVGLVVLISSKEEEDSEDYSA
jgi:hypothetical protein